jgi:hypothetical protein
MKLAKIYYKDELIQHEKLNYVKYIKIDKLDNIIFNDKNSLNIIIGWDLLSELKKINILNKKINNNSIWEFSFSEKRIDYFNFTRNIPNLIFDYYIGKLTKKNIDFGELNKLITEKSKIFINKNKILFLIENKTIYCLNIKEFEFFDKINTRNYLNELKNKNINIFYDKDDKFFKRAINYFEGVDHEYIKMLLPYLFYVISYKK